MLEVSDILAVPALCQDTERWHKHREALLDPLLPHMGSSDALYPAQEGGPGPMGEQPGVSTILFTRRRGGLIEQRDIVKAHQAHKIQSTPQARRKEWE
ncbi:voltage-dependent R-type calcium channel subunit alpha-1E [Tachysurus ichikawai]